MKITWLGHSGALIELAGKTLAIDPFVEGNSTFPSNMKSALQDIDYLLLTHAHADHFGDALQIAKDSGATVVGTFELVNYMNTQGIESIEPMNTGGTIELAGSSESSPIQVTLTPAFHSSSIQTDEGFLPAGDPNGFVIRAEGQSIYHAGDTALFSDMQLIDALYKPTVGLLPIGDRFTMGPDTAAYACNNFLNLTTVLPVHYGTFEMLSGTPEAFKPLVSKGNVASPKPGETLVFSENGTLASASKAAA